MGRNDDRLQLNWTNKELRLLSHGANSYEWVDPADWRASEVRLLQLEGSYGDDDGSNLLIEGDSLHALTSLTALPEFAERYVGKVRLCYIDPPFNTGQTFNHYDDAVEHSVWLTMLRDRLVIMKKLLAPTGSIWVHLDDSEVHRARAVLDEVFGAANFLATIAWQKRTSRENRTAFSVSQDYILVYARKNAKRWKDHRSRIPRLEGGLSNPDQDPLGPWDSVPLHAQGFRQNQMYDITTPTGVVHRPPRGRCWGCLEPEYQRLLAEGRIYFPRGGDGIPRVKKYAFEDEGLVPHTMWLASEVGTNDDAKKQLLEMFLDGDTFDTPKPEPLMQRIIAIATDPGDIVVDCFAGSGTTAAVAHKMGRRWVTSELSADTVATFTRPRLQMVVDGESSGISATEVELAEEQLPEGLEPKQVRDAAKVLGDLVSAGLMDIGEGDAEAALPKLLQRFRAAGRVTKELQTSWVGGGGFRVLRVGPSMFELDDNEVFLADWVSGGALADAVRAQLRFESFDEAPFVGQRGQQRLAVIDGMLTRGVADYLFSRLPDNEKLIVVAQALEPDIEDYVRGTRPGSRAKKIPRDFARSGVLAARAVTTTPRMEQSP